MNTFFNTIKVNDFHFNFLVKVAPIRGNNLIVGSNDGVGTLIGVIENGDNFIKVSNIKVAISSLGKYTYTNQDGEFEIQSIQVGIYTVTVGEGVESFNINDIKITSGAVSNKINDIGINKSKRTMRTTDFPSLSSEFDARESEWIKYRNNDALEKKAYLWQDVNGNYHQSAVDQTDASLIRMPYHDTVKKCVRFDGVYNRFTYTPYKTQPRGNYKSGFLVVSNAKGGVEENTGVTYPETRVIGSSPYSGDEENAWGLNQVILGTGKSYTVKLQNIKGKCNINGYAQYPSSGYADEITCPTPAGFSTFPINSNELTIIGFDLEKSEGVYSLGMAKGPTGKVTFNGLDVYRVVLFNEVLSQADRQKVEGILAHEYSIQSKLPDTHPYKSSVPKIEYPELKDDLVGMNVDWFFDSVPFVDMVKTARDWTGATLNDDGDPLGDAEIVLFVYRESATENRTYSCSFICDNTPVISFETETTDGSGITVTVSNISRDPVTRLVTFNLSVPSVIKTLKLKLTNTNTGVRNLKVLDDKYPKDQLLTDWFTDMYEGYNVLRFMEVVSTNGSTEQYWNDRVNPNKGSSWESIIDIANELQTNVWINIPHLVDDDYILNLASLLYSRLDSKLDIYVEISNECWNGHVAFTQSQYYLSKHNERSAIDPAYNSIESFNNAFLKIPAERAYQAAKIFKGVFGSTSLNNRIKFTLGAQSSNLPSLEIQLRFLEQYYSPMKVKDYFYAATLAFYVDSQFDGTVQDISDQTQLEIDKINSLIYITPHLLMCKKYGINKLISYEGGYDIVGGRAFSETTQAQRDFIHSSQAVEQMNNLVEKFNNYSNGGLALWYKGGSNSAWGVTTSTDIMGTPKSKELKKYIAERKRSD